MHGRFVDSVLREKEQGVPLQHLGELVNVEGFDIDSWVQPEVAKNEVSTACHRADVYFHDLHQCLLGLQISLSIPCPWVSCKVVPNVLVHVHCAKATTVMP